MKKILVVDDEWAILELLRIKLTKKGFDVITASNEKEFFEQVFENKPDLIILDIWLGNEGGGTKLYDVALDGGLDPDVPVIFMSALVEEGTPPKRASKGGRFALYGKPFDFNFLLEDIYCLTGVESGLNSAEVDRDRIGKAANLGKYKSGSNGGPAPQLKTG